MPVNSYCSRSLNFSPYCRKCAKAHAANRSSLVALFSSIFPYNAFATARLMRSSGLLLKAASTRVYSRPAYSLLDAYQRYSSFHSDEGSDSPFFRRPSIRYSIPDSGVSTSCSRCSDSSSIIRFGKSLRILPIR